MFAILPDGLCAVAAFSCESSLDFVARLAQGHVKPLDNNYKLALRHEGGPEKMGRQYTGERRATQDTGRSEWETTVRSTAPGVAQARSQS